MRNCHGPCKHLASQNKMTVSSYILIKPNTSPISPLPPRSLCKAEHAGVSVVKNNALVLNSKKKKRRFHELNEAY
jgi:hypothetical protein